MAEIEDSDDGEGISRIQEKCQIAATLTGQWSPLIKPQNEEVGSGGKNQVLSRLLSSKQRLLSLTSSPPTQRSLSFSPTLGSNLGDEGGKITPEENKLFKRFMPSPKVRDALLFRKSAEKDDDDSEKDGFFRRLLRDSKDDDEELTSSSDGFFKRLFRDSKMDSEERSISRSIEDVEKENFFRKIIKDVFDDKKDGSERNDGEDKDGSRKSIDEEDKEGFFRKLFKDKFEDKKENERQEVDVKNDSKISKEEEKDGFFRKFFKEKLEDKKEATERNDDEDDDKEGFFRKFFKEKFEEKKNLNTILNDEEKVCANGDEEEPSDFPLFRRLFRVHPEEAKTTTSEMNGFDSSPGTENFFRKLFRDRDRCVEDSELFGLKKQKEVSHFPFVSSIKSPLENSNYYYKFIY